jgi:hypothetical protein
VEATAAAALEDEENISSYLQNDDWRGKERERERERMALSKLEWMDGMEVKYVDGELWKV